VNKNVLCYLNWLSFTKLQEKGRLLYVTAHTEVKKPNVFRQTTVLSMHWN